VSIVDPSLFHLSLTPMNVGPELVDGIWFDSRTRLGKPQGAVPTAAEEEKTFFAFQY
jgi:hypothetical protein